VKNDKLTTHRPGYILPGIFVEGKTMTISHRWSQRPPGSTWGDFGADDQLGRLNLLTPEKVRQGIAEVRDGRSFCLSLPLVHLGELWWLTPHAQHLRKSGRNRFFLTAPPLRLPGAIASPVTPVGTT
jgi:hypothetical protein